MRRIEAKANPVVREASEYTATVFAVNDSTAFRADRATHLGTVEWIGINLFYRNLHGFGFFRIKLAGVAYKII